MKQPPKPFAIEIKRSRRAPTAAAPADLFVKDSTIQNRPVTAFFSKRDNFTNAADASDFVVPSFLQNDKAAYRTSPDHAATEAAQVFRPRAAAAADNFRAPEPRPAPRILPSLVPPENFDRPQNSAEAAPRARTRPSKVPDASPPKQKAAAKANRVELIDALSKRRTRAADANSADTQSQRRAAAEWSAAPAPAKMKSAPAQRIESAPDADGAAQLSNSRRSAQLRSFSRRGRDDPATLPPGQHWKRRLNPRAW